MEGDEVKAVLGKFNHFLMDLQKVYIVEENDDIKVLIEKEMAELDAFIHFKHKLFMEADTMISTTTAENLKFKNRELHALQVL